MGYMQHTGTEGATTGLTGHAMSCLGSSTGTAVYTSACALVTGAPSSVPSPAPSSLPSGVPSFSPTPLPSTTPVSPSSAPSLLPSHSTSYRLQFQQELSGVTTAAVESSLDSFLSTIAATLNVTQDSVTVTDLTSNSSSSTTASRAILSLLRKGISAASAAAVVVDYSVLTSDASNAAVFTSSLNAAVTSGQLLTDLQAASATFALVTAVSAATYVGTAVVYNSHAPSSSPSMSPSTLSPTLTVDPDENEAFIFDAKIILALIVAVAGSSLVVVLCFQQRERTRLRRVQQDTGRGVAMTAVGLPDPKIQ